MFHFKTVKGGETKTIILSVKVYGALVMNKWQKAKCNFTLLFIIFSMINHYSLHRYAESTFVIKT